ncbi:MAG: hypothetical protein ACLSGS_08335 [Adlercreutzia sp.]
MTAEQIAEVERLANQKIMENHPVRAYETSLASAHAKPASWRCSARSTASSCACSTSRLFAGAVRRYPRFGYERNRLR